MPLTRWKFHLAPRRRRIVHCSRRARVSWKREGKRKERRSVVFHKGEYFHEWRATEVTVNVLRIIDIPLIGWNASISWLGFFWPGRKVYRCLPVREKSVSERVFFLLFSLLFSRLSSPSESKRLITIQCEFFSFFFNFKSRFRAKIAKDNGG